MLWVTIYNLVWGPCDDAMKAQLKQHANFQTANNKSSIIKLLAIVDKFCISGKFGNTCDAIFWALIQNRKLFKYTQTPKKETNIWLKDLSDL